MTASEKLITQNLDVWSSAIKQKASTGRGSSSKQELYGVNKLRELILELAVRGLLTPQNIADEPASTLLEKIEAEKIQLLKEKKIKKPKKFEEIVEEELPFSIPESWSWVRLSDVGHDWGQKKPEHTFTYIDVGAVNKELGFIEEPSVVEASEAPSRARKLVKKGTVIYSTVRPYLLNIAVINEDFSPEPIASTAFAIIHPFEGIQASFVYRYLRSPSFIKYVESCQTGVASPAVNDKQFFSGVIPVPPESEQKRIVAKVDELMVLCDQLEQQQENSINAHQTLVETLLGALTNASGKGDFDTAWARIAEYFDILFTTDHSIEKLKKTILQLALMGRLVPQNSNDEPAGVLLKNILAEKEKLIKEKKIKKQKPLPEITNDETRLEIPDSWSWLRLGDAFDVRDGTHDSPKYQESGYPLVTSKNIYSRKLDLTNVKYISEEDHLKISERSKVDKGDILFAMIGSIGNAVIIDIEPEFSVKNVGLFKYYDIDLSCPEYLLYYLQLAENWFKEESSGAVQSFVSLGKLRSYPYPLAPLEEQKRIVAKVDELMALCDQLKIKINGADTTQQKLADAMAEQALS